MALTDTGACNWSGSAGDPQQRPDSKATPTARKYFPKPENIHLGHSHGQSGTDHHPGKQFQFAWLILQFAFGANSFPVEFQGFPHGTVLAWNGGNMNKLMMEAVPLQTPKPTYREVASLAWKFYLDSNRENGYDLENWLCAEHMLRQKQLIELQVGVLHGRKLGTVKPLWAS
jgi:hypothetical protein